MFWNPELLTYVLGLVYLIIITGHVMWYTEREINSGQFPKDYFEGVDEGIWWSMVTITTVGYGDKTPVTSTGRSMAIGWMFVGLIVYGSVSGLMASAFTEASLAGATSVTLDSMKGKPICTITVYSMFLPKEEGFDTVIHDQNTQSTCVDMVLSGAAAGFFYDSMSLTYLVKNNDTMKKRLLFSDLMVPVGFAPVFPEAGANLTRIDRFQEFNVAVLETLRDYRWFEELFAKWVGTIPSTNYGDPNEVRAAQWKACLGLFVPLLAWIVFYNCAQAWILSKEAPVEPGPVHEQDHEESEWSADILPGQKDHSLPRPIDLPPHEDAASPNLVVVQPDRWPSFIAENLWPSSTAFKEMPGTSNPTLPQARAKALPSRLSR